MVFSKTVIDNTLNYLKDNFELVLTQCEIEYQTTITRLTDFDIVNKANLQYPICVLLENNSLYQIEMLNASVKQYRFFCDFIDSRADLNQLRNNLYAYRDGVTTLIEALSNPYTSTYDKTKMGSYSQAYMYQISPAKIMYETGNYTGLIECQFIVEVIN